MTARTGGRVPPDGRPSTAKQPGRNARRHDLEKPKTPGLYNSDLQQGDVQAMEQGQRIVPVRQQPPAVAAQRGGAPRPPRAAPRGGDGGGPPDPIDFLGGRLQGTLTGAGQTLAPNSQPDMRTWLPLLKRLSVATGASGVLAQAYISQLRNAMTQTFTHETPLIDMQEADDDLEALLGP